MTNEEKSNELIAGDESINISTVRLLIKDKVLQMAEWKDEQHEQSLIDLNCKLEEQQANYEELKKRYDEAVEREKIATKIINELRARK